MTAYRYHFIYYLSISIICVTRLNYAVFDQQELMQNVNFADVQDSRLPEHIVQLLQESSNEAKFTLARMILTKTNEHVREPMRAYLKKVITFSYQPRELYTYKTLKLVCWGQWINVQKNSQGTHYQTTPDDIHRLFECYDLPQSAEHYTNLNKKIYHYYELDPMRRYARSESITEEDMRALMAERKELECKLYESLVQELRDRYGIILTAEHVKTPYDCTFKAYLAVNAQAEQKLQDYIDQQLEVN